MHIWIGVRVVLIYRSWKKNIKTNLIEENVNFVDVTKKQNRKFKIIMFSVAVNIVLFLFFVFF